jgi:catechol 2,3-dioxygenase-like lactoylglutathione lyase family enzyme
MVEPITATAARWTGMIEEAGVTVIGLDHVQLAMPAGREGDARLFYSGLLGIPERPKPGHLVVRGGVWFESGDVKVHLGVDPNFRPARKAHAGLLVADLKPLVARLRSAGYEIVGAEPLPGYEHVYVDDPFGNRLELLEKA